MVRFRTRPKKNSLRILTVFIIDDPSLVNSAAVPKKNALTEVRGTIGVKEKQHTFDQAITHACMSADASEEEKVKDKWVLNKLSLQSCSLFHTDENNNVIEFNALSHQVNINCVSELPPLQC